MTSAITPGTIDSTFPIAGQDNDTQGFRNNYAAIKTNFTTAASEITNLQSNAVLTANLTTNAPVQNNLNGSSITNGVMSQMSTLANGPITVGSATTVSFNNGSFQAYVMSGNVAFTFRDWPTSGNYAQIRLQLTSSTATTQTATFYTNGGTIELGNAGINPNGFPATGNIVSGTPIGTLPVPAQFTFTTNGVTSSGSTTIVLHHAFNIQVGATITSGAGGLQSNTYIVSATGYTVTLSAATTASIPDGTTITVNYYNTVPVPNYIGTRLLEACTYDGGATVWLRQLADF